MTRNNPDTQPTVTQRELQAAREICDLLFLGQVADPHAAVAAILARHRSQETARSADEHLHAMHETVVGTQAAREILAAAFEPQFPVEAEKARKGLHFMLPSSWAVEAIQSVLTARSADVGREGVCPVEHLAHALRNTAENQMVECAEHVLQDMANICLQAAAFIEAALTTPPADDGEQPCPKCDDSGYQEFASGGIWTGENITTRREFCDCPCGHDARDQKARP